jgi:NAD(P)-dependent dehydrogenase (short-subunit alcohol dehydrogenase family)
MAKTESLRIVLTGSTRGLGRALVERFAALGHTVLGCGRSQTHIEQLQQRFGPPHRFHVVDVADARQVQSWAEEILPGGAPDLLLNNAALMNHPARLWKVPAEEFDRLIDVNIKGVVNMVRSFLPAILARKKGVIVNFSSGWGRSTSPEVAPYCCSKWAIEGLTQALAQELPTGLAAVALNPGIIDTEMLRTCWGDGAGEYPSPDQWSEQAVPFLLSLGPRHNGGSLTVPRSDRD